MEKKENNSTYNSLKIGFLELLNKKWKVLFIFIYIVIIGFLLNGYIHLDHTHLKEICNMFYPLVNSVIEVFVEDSTISVESFYLIIQNTLYVLALFLAFFGLLKVIIFIGMTYSATKKQERILNVEFPNGLIPKYVEEKNDKEREHGKIITFECGGATQEDYEERISKIESALKFYKIYKIKQDKIDKSKMNIFCLPTKYYKPKLISPNTNFNDIFFMNLLLSGKSGSR